MFNYNKFDFSSPYSQYANKELLWLPTDSHERYMENRWTQKYKLEMYGWLEKKITYKFNSLGFRCNEFADQPTAMFLGCSNTVGVGMPVEELWAELVAKELNLACANFGIGGGASDCAFRMCLGYIDKIKPKIVIYNQPPGARLEVVTSPQTRNVILSDTEHEYVSKFTNDFLMHDTNIEMNRTKNLLAIKFLCHERNIKFAYFDNYQEEFSPLARSDYARDLMHFGTIHNAEFAKHVLSKI
jgi:hypothetical protein